MAEAQWLPAPTGGMLGKIARMAEISAERKRARQCDEPAESVRTAVVPCEMPESEQRPEFLVPGEYDVSPLDFHLFMDLAFYRLTKRKPLANEMISYELPDGHVHIISSLLGMATVWDYDIVLMAVSHITEAMNRYRAGKGPKPGPYFRPRVADVLKFCKRGDGGKQREQISDALDRLASTYVRIQRTRKFKNKLITFKTGENLIAKHTLVANSETGKVEFIEIKIADSMYGEISKEKGLDVLRINPDYFFIKKGVGRFIYRLARQAAGKGTATWGFRTLYERSCSTSPFSEFSRILREVINESYFPDYWLRKINGQMGEMLEMTYKLMIKTPVVERAGTVDEMLERSRGTESGS